MRIFSKFSGNAGESGRSMVEMLGVLAIIGVLTVGGVAGFNFAMNKHRANEIIQGVKERAVIGSGQRINDHAVDFHEFPELIIDYTTSGRNTGLNGEKEFFSVDVADVPQAVCQNVLNMNWDWPSGVFVNGVREETCPAENSQMTFVFAADLSSKIAQEQDPCYGSTNSCCISVGRNAYYGERSDIYDCKGAGEKICCNKTGVDQCIYPQDANYTKWKDNAVKGLDPTCTKHPNQSCDADLNCKCGTCPNTNMVYDALCNCLCPAGYQDTACSAGKYAAEKLENSSGEAVCYKCQTCPGLPPQDPACTYTAGTDANGCPTQTIDSCACDSGYTTAACVTGTTYQVDMKTLTDGTQCYKCAGCTNLPPRDTACSYTMGTDANGCPTQTIGSCACDEDNGYTTNACVAGTNYQMDMKTLTDGTQCYKCAECPQDETKPADRCTESKTEAGQNGCPSRTVYKDVTPDACHQCVNGQLQLKDPRQTLVKGDTCCEPSEKDSTKCKVPCSGTGTACQECDDTTGEWKNLPTNSKARGYDCGKCDSKGKVVKDTSVKVPDCKTCNSKTFMFDNKKDGTTVGKCGKCQSGVAVVDTTKETACKTCNATTWKLENKTNGTAIGECGMCKNGVIAADSTKYRSECQTCDTKTGKIKNKTDGTVCGTCGKCGNGTCAGDYTATTTVKKYGGNNTACCRNTTVSYCPLRGKPADECTGDKVQEFWTKCTEGGGRSEKHGNYSHHVTNLCTNERSVRTYSCYGGKPTNGPKANCKTNVHTGAVTCK